jgi:hypothetical protein
MDLAFLGQVATIFFTIAVWTFLYKENPIYRIAEHMMIGAAAGYYLVTNWNYIVKNGFGGLTSGKYWYVIGILLGVLLFTNLSKRYAWISRYGLSIIIGTGIGLVTSTIIPTNIIKQIAGAVAPLSNANTPLLMFNFVLSICLTIGVIYYFVYADSLRSAKLDKVQVFGRFGLMMAFGVAYGQTVGYRLNLIISRMDVIVAPDVISITGVIAVIVIALLAVWTYMKQKQ